MKPARRWRVLVVVREIVLNIGIGWPWHLIAGCICIVTVAFVAHTDATAVIDALTAERDLTTAGQYTLVITGTAESRGPTIDSGTCLDLNSYPFVVAAGGLQHLGSGEIGSHPGTPFRLYAGTGSIRRVLDPNDKRGGASGIAAPLAKQLGVPDHSTVDLETLDGAETQAHLSSDWFEPGTRHEFGDIMWISGQRLDAIDECWVEFVPAASPYARGITRAAAAFDGNVAVVNVVPSDERGTLPIDLFEERATNGLYIYFGLLIALPACLIMWFQRARTALYRSLGSGRLTATAVAYLESSWVILLCTSIGLLSAEWRLGSDVRSAAIDYAPVVTRNTLIMLAASHALLAVVATALSSGSIASQLKDHG
jgi:hypothetical protein